MGWLPTYYKERFNLSQTIAGLYATGYLHPASLAGVLLGGYLADRWSRTNPRARILLPAIALCIAALIEPEESPLRTTLLNTAFVTKPKHFNAPHLEDRIKSEMKKNHRTFSATQRIELALSLAQDGNLDDFPVLISFLNDEDVHGIYESDSDEGADVRAAAAYAILKIKQR